MKIQNEEAVSPGKAVTTEDAVSPVIGVILMVAITVILAAVIAAFVFGLAGTTGTSKNVGFTATANDTSFRITTQGGVDLPTMTALKWVAPNGTAVNLSTFTGTVGQTIVITDDVNDYSGTGNRLVLSGTFEDGTTQVIFDKQF